MSTLLEQRAAAIIDDLLALPTEERSVAAAAACAGDTQLLARVQSLLSALPMVDGFLSDVTVDAPMEAPVTEHPGSMIGRYKLLQQIGEGGFGVVFMAAQEKPVRRQVALKVIKLGMDTREVVARFEAERQALAMMDHPNIAKVLDAGATETGRPYFVMELVRGSSITEYCDKHRLDTAGRVALLSQVCRAVQHAHSKGIIHRDLKPSNVLVTVIDDKPVPKVIDFGIAKATQATLTGRTLYTGYRQMIGTPQYMSPEQADSDGIDIDTRTDVYSLGVLLYELLVGTTPFDAKQLRSAAYDAMRKMIREQEPPKPSTRLDTLVDTLASVASCRATNPKRLGQTVRGELDWIVMRALEKDRRRRYETAAALADDLDRHLVGDLVMAGPPSGMYRVKKFARRHKGLIGTVAMVLVVLLLGVAGTTFGLVRESHEKHEADTRRIEAEHAKADAETARAEASKQQAAAEDERDGARAAVTYLTRDVLDAAFRQQPHDVAARAVLSAVLTRPSVLDVTARFPGHPLEAANVREALAWSLDAVGQSELAAKQALAALKTRRKLLGDDNRDTIRSEVLVVNFEGTPDELKMSQDAYERAQRVCGPNDPTTLWAMYIHSRVLNDAGRSVEALPLIRKAYEGQSAVLGPDHPDTLATLQAYAVVTEWAGHPDEAVALAQEALNRCQRVRGPEDATTIWCVAGLGNALRAAGRGAEAADQYADVIARMTKWLGPNDGTTLLYLNFYVHALSELGRAAEAEHAYKSLWDAAIGLYGKDHIETLAAKIRYARFIDAQGRHAEAEPLLKQSWETELRLQGADHPETVEALFEYANTLFEQHRYADAEPLYKQCWDTERRIKSDVDPDTLHMARSYLTDLDAQGRGIQSRRQFNDELRRLRPDDPFQAELLMALGRRLALNEQWAEAIAPLREALAGARSTPNLPVATLARILYYLGHADLQTNRVADAEPLFRELVYLDRSEKPFNPGYLAGALDALGTTLEQLGPTHAAEARALLAEEETVRIRELPEGTVRSAITGPVLVAP